jgi:hypothetical protein
VAVVELAAQVQMVFHLEAVMAALVVLAVNTAFLAQHCTIPVAAVVAAVEIAAPMT